MGYSLPKMPPPKLTPPKVRIGGTDINPLDPIGQTIYDNKDTIAKVVTGSGAGTTTAGTGVSNVNNVVKKPVPTLVAGTPYTADQIKRWTLKNRPTEYVQNYLGVNLKNLSNNQILEIAKKNGIDPAKLGWDANITGQMATYTPQQIANWTKTNRPLEWAKNNGVNLDSFTADQKIAWAQKNGIDPAKINFSPPKLETPNISANVKIPGIPTSTDELSGRIGDFGRVAIDENTIQNVLQNATSWNPPANALVKAAYGDTGDLEKMITTLDPINGPKIMEQIKGVSVNKTPRENIAAILNYLPDSVVQQAVGDRGLGERVTGIPSGEVPSTGNGGVNEGLNPGENPQGYMGTPDNTVSGASQVTFPKETTPSWYGLVSNDESKADTDAIKRRYNLLQQNLTAREGATAQAEQDALARRFASMGASNSGVALRNSQLQADVSNRRFGESSNALAAQQSAEQQAAIEAMNARNMDRQKLRVTSEEAQRDRALEQSKIMEGARQFEKEFQLNEKIANNNIAIANQTMKDNGQGMIQALFNSLFGTGWSWKKIGDQTGLG